MANVYSHRLSTGQAGSVKDIDPVAGYVRVIRFITTFNSDGARDATFHMFSGTYGLTYLQWSLAPSSAQTFDFHLVLIDDEVVQFNNDLSIDYSVSGYLLTLP